MQKITKLQREIADRHINARFGGSFDQPDFQNSEQLIERIRDGKAYHELLKEVEIRHVSITSLLFVTLGHQSDAYTKAVRRGFKELLNKWGVQ